MGSQMNFPKFHGIALANNSWIENLHFERLLADPLPISPGRVWFNNVEKCIKFSSLDAGGAIVIHTFANLEDMQAGLDSLFAALASEGDKRASADTAEALAREAAITLLQTAITDEATARTAAIAAEAVARAAGDAAEAAARVDADAVAAATAANQLATETTARLSGDAALGVRVDAVQAELDKTQTGAGLNVNGSYTAPENTANLSDATSLKDADVRLDAALVTEVATRTGQVAGLASGLANETQSRIDGDTALHAQLQAYIDSAVTNNTNADNAETVARIAADAAIKAELDRTQATVGTDADGNLIPITGTNYLNEVTTVFGGAFVLDTQIKIVSDAVAAEGVARATADTAFNTALNTEITNRAATDDAQQQEINRVEAGAGLEANGAYASPTGSNYLNSATSLKDADFKLDAAVKATDGRVDVLVDTTIPAVVASVSAEQARAIAAETAEAATRSAADVAGAAATADEVTRAKAAELALSNDITAETAARVSAIGGVVTAISTEQTRAQNAEIQLQLEISSLQASAGAGANALMAELDAGRYNIETSAPALVHVITHNLNSSFIIERITVQGIDGVYRNDIVPVEEIDGNSFRVSLTEARRIRVSVQDNQKLGVAAP
jgi:hypothetical protein